MEPGMILRGLPPQGKTIALTANGTFGPYSQDTIVKITSDGAYELAATGISATWTKVTFLNTSVHTITLTDPTPNQSLAADGLGILVFDGTTWR